HNLHCVNDYLSTINCSLVSMSQFHPFPWYRGESLECRLSWNNDRFYCSVECDDFVDTDVYQISLCYKRESTGCEVLDEKYSPVQNIKPRPPCCLTLNHNSSQHHFYWNSTYEGETGFIALPKELTYQLNFYQRGQQFNGKQLNTGKTTLTVHDDHFKPDSDYVAEVRSSPTRSYSEKGQWSDCSPKIHWRTQPTADGNTSLSNLKKLLILVCVLLLFSCCRWKQVYIPTPEPYFHTLYTDCHGDFKSWVIMDNTVDLPITEKTNHIEKIVECEDIHEVAPSLPQGSGYANMSGSECSRSPEEGDSGCWLSSDPSLEQNHLWYCNDYCTLSAFQQSALCTPSGSLKCGTCMIMRHDAIEETM
uniref:Fibronectin type-III domain-containing protein n=1 Tax=Neogobius melanostomus TaxID=47308 RepID=A0A8C6UI15_9GOBI